MSRTEHECDELTRTALSSCPSSRTNLTALRCANESKTVMFMSGLYVQKLRRRPRRVTPHTETPLVSAGRTCSLPSSFKIIPFWTFRQITSGVICTRFYGSASQLEVQITIPQSTAFYGAAGCTVSLAPPLDMAP